MLKNIKKRLKDQRGLTLIELLAVIVILGIIAAIAIPSIGNIIQNTRIDSVKSDAIQILNAAKMHNSSNNVENNTDVPIATLKQYVDLESTWSEDETGGTFVNISFDTNNKATYKITGTGTSASGGVSVTFDEAELSNINAARKGLTTIDSATTAETTGD